MINEALALLCVLAVSSLALMQIAIGKPKQ